MADIWLNLRHKYEPFERVNIVHFNDIHENTNNLDSFITGRDEFYKAHSGETNLTLAAGDIFNRFPQNERIVSNFVKDYVDATSTGNRDLEKGKRLNKSINKYGLKDKFVGTNVYYEGENPLSDKIVKSKVINNIGIIGLAPVDFKPRLERKDNTNIKTENLENTIDTVKKQAEEFEKQGINKIILLAHTGEYSGHGRYDRHDIDYYKEFSKIPGIDVIIGGHDHRQTNRWEKTDRGEPVKIVSTGFAPGKNFEANLDSFGEMSLIFDKRGVLKPELCTNKFVDTNSFEKSNYTQQFPHHIINWGKLTDKALSKFYDCVNSIKQSFFGS